MPSYQRERKDELMNQARRRGLIGQDTDPSNTTKDELVDLLEEADRRDAAVSERENQGRQTGAEFTDGDEDQVQQAQPRAVRGEREPSPASRGQEGMMPSDEAVATGEGALGQHETAEGDTVDPIADVPGSREGPEADLAEPTQQPTQAPRPVASGGQWAGPPGSGDAAAAIAAKQNAVGGEGMVSPAEGLAAAEAGNAQVAENFQPELEAGWRGLNPAAHQNVEHTVAGHLAYQQLSPEEQVRRRREIHEANRRNLTGDDWS